VCDLCGFVEALLWMYTALLRMELCECTMMCVQVCRGSFADVWGSFADVWGSFALLQVYLCERTITCVQMCRESHYVCAGV